MEDTYSERKMERMYSDIMIHDAFRTEVTLMISNERIDYIDKSLVRLYDTGRLFVEPF